MGAVCFTSVFWAWVRITWKGLALKWELAITIECRIFSSFLASRISRVHWPDQGAYSAFFRLVCERGAPFPSPINPVFGDFAGGLEGSFFGGSARVSPADALSLDSIAAIADWMSDRPPPASSSLAFRFSRLACDLEYGRRDASTSRGWFAFGYRTTGDMDLLSSNLACLSILFSFFGATGFKPASVEDSVSRISAAYSPFVTTPYKRYWCVLDRAYRQVLPAAYINAFYLILLDCELSPSRRLNCSVMSLGSETGRLWLCFRFNIRQQ